MSTPEFNKMLSDRIYDLMLQIIDKFSKLTYRAQPSYYNCMAYLVDFSYKNKDHKLTVLPMLHAIMINHEFKHFSKNRVGNKDSRCISIIISLDDPQRYKIQINDTRWNSAMMSPHDKRSSKTICDLLYNLNWGDEQLKAAQKALDRLETVISTCEFEVGSQKYMNFA